MGAGSALARRGWLLRAFMRALMQPPVLATIAML